MSDRALEIIETLELIKHPEGGYYKEEYRSEGMLSIGGHKRAWLTDIYFLLPAGEVSRLHRVKHDEVWHFYEGAPLKLIEIAWDFDWMKEIIIGRKSDLHYKHCIRGNNWQAARSLGDYTLVGCTVAPGFDFEDFSMLSRSKELVGEIEFRFPGLKKFI